MASKDRNNPIRHKSSESDYSLMEFMAQYPDDAACLDALWREKYAPDGHHAHCPKCDRERKFHRTRTRASYTCDTCGLHVHPMKGTIFEKSTTGLHLWFYAMYLIASTRCGISAKQLERELGVTYKTAHRMFKKIRTELMNDEGDDQLGGDVEIDETSWGGKPRNAHKTRSEASRFREAKPTILGMVERGGRVRLRVIPSRRGPALSRAVKANVNPSSLLFTDDWQAYKPLKYEGYIGHRIINHSKGLYVEGGVHTNTIEGFFGNSKPACAGRTSMCRHATCSPTWTSSLGDITRSAQAVSCFASCLLGRRAKAMAWARVGLAALVPVGAMIVYGLNNKDEAENTTALSISVLVFVAGLLLLGLAVYRAK